MNTEKRYSLNADTGRNLPAMDLKTGTMSSSSDLSQSQLSPGITMYSKS